MNLLQGKHEPTDEEAVFPLADTDSEDEDRFDHRIKLVDKFFMNILLWIDIGRNRFTEINEDGSKKADEDLKGMPSFWLTIFQVVS